MSLFKQKSNQPFYNNIGEFVNVDKKTRRFLKKGLKNNVIALYGIALASNPDTYITIVPDQNLIPEAMNKHAFWRFHDHFALWCSYRENDITYSEEERDHYKARDLNAFDHYLEDVLSKEPDKINYTITTLYFAREDIASIIRMFFSCAPLDYSFVKDDEFRYYCLDKDFKEFTSEFKKYLEITIPDAYKKAEKIDQMESELMQGYDKSKIEKPKKTRAPRKKKEVAPVEEE